MVGAAALAAALGMAAEPARYRHRTYRRAPQAQGRVVPPAVAAAEDVVPFPPPTITILRVRKDNATFDERWRAQWGR
jgi:hypothetical protein